MHKTPRKPLKTWEFSSLGFLLCWEMVSPVAHVWAWVQHWVRGKRSSSWITSASIWHPPTCWVYYPGLAWELCWAQTPPQQMCWSTAQAPPLAPRKITLMITTLEWCWNPWNAPGTVVSFSVLMHSWDWSPLSFCLCVRAGWTVIFFSGDTFTQSYRLWRDTALQTDCESLFSLPHSNKCIP